MTPDEFLSSGYTRKATKVSLAIFLLSVIIAICSIIAYNFLCPDIIVIYDIINKIKN